ncbi:hypothetical protein [Trinickia sp. LjRoot230]|uniref:hypothetical protein n=1 Tax=Trinickia sp. LjRoot230 TaxID=3342288 RepID=UPI003F502464
MQAQVALRASTPAERREALDRLTASAQRGARLAGQLLDLARLEAGERAARMASVDLHELDTLVTKTNLAGTDYLGVLSGGRVSWCVTPLTVLTAVTFGFDAPFSRFRRHGRGDATKMRSSLFLEVGRVATSVPARCRCLFGPACQSDRKRYFSRRCESGCSVRAGRSARWPSASLNV